VPQRVAPTLQAFMMNLHLTTLLLGVGLGVVLVILLRGNLLHLGHGVFWFLVAVTAVGLGIWPRILDGIASLVGIAYAPTLLLLLAVMVLLVKSLHNDILVSRLEGQLRRLNQRLALYEVASPPELDRTEAPSSDD
jgi:hypothetical protein